MKKIGITGGIGSGKSLICRIFSVLGVPVYDADSRARWLTDNDPELINAVKLLFGESIYSDGSLDRRKVASLVFPDPGLLAKLNDIIHPRVGRDFADWVRHQKAPYVLKEAALMFESKSNQQLDGVINVAAPQELRIRRVLARDTFRSESDIRQIMARQLGDRERSEKSDWNILNDDRHMVIPQVLRLHEILLHQ